MHTYIAWFCSAFAPSLIYLFLFDLSEMLMFTVLDIIILNACSIEYIVDIEFTTVQYTKYI